MSLREFIKYLLNHVYDLNNYSLVIANPNWKKNGLGPWIDITEKSLEKPEGSVFVIHLPKGYKLVKEKVK